MIVVGNLKAFIFFILVANFLLFGFSFFEDAIADSGMRFDRCADGVRDLGSDALDRWARRGPGLVSRPSGDTRRPKVFQAEAISDSPVIFFEGYQYSERLRAIVRIAVATQDLKAFVNQQEGLPVSSSLLFLVPQLVNKSKNPERVREFLDVWRVDSRRFRPESESRARRTGLGRALRLLQEELIENGDEVAIALSKQRFDLLKTNEGSSWPKFMELDEANGFLGYERPLTSEGWDDIEPIYIERSVSAIYKQLYSQI